MAPEGVTVAFPSLPPVQLTESWDVVAPIGVGSSMITILFLIQPFESVICKLYVSADKFVTVCEVLTTDPLLPVHKYEYGFVPFVAITEPKPVVSPLHKTSEEAINNVILSGSVIIYGFLLS